MACAKCAFYRPKGSSQAQILEAKANLLRMKQEIPLTEEELSAIEDGLEALEKLSEQLADMPTPAGLTPRQLGQLGTAAIRTDVKSDGTFIPLLAIQDKTQMK